MVTVNSNGDSQTKYYTEWTNSSIDFVEANDTNQSYATAENFSDYFIDTHNEIIYVDANNKNDVNTTECAKMYGLGWRIPTAYEMGLKTDDKESISAMSGSGNGYIPAYTGHLTNQLIFTSSQFGNDNRVIALELVDEYSNGLWQFINLATNDSANKSYIRCIYAP